jgi:hypothetical protein
MPTLDDLLELARAICKILRTAAGWPNPFSFNLYANNIPHSIVEEVESGMGADRFAGRPGGPMGKDIRRASLEVAVDDRGCVYQFGVTGAVKRDHSRRRETHYTEWRSLS